MPPQEIPEYKREFLAWLDRFARIPQDFKRIVTNYEFTPGELETFRRQVEAKYKLKAEYVRGRARGA